MEHLAQPLGSFGAESRVGGARAGGALVQRLLEAPFIEGVDGALRTVWSLQPRARAIREACSPLSLASKVWQRRRMEASDERRPSSRAWRSSSVSGRTKIGFFMALRLASHLPPHLRKH